MKILLTTEIDVPATATREQAEKWIEREISLLTSIRVSDARDEPIKDNPLSDYEVEWDLMRLKWQVKQSRTTD